MTATIDNPILNSPYEQPDRYYEIGPDGPTGEIGQQINGIQVATQESVGAIKAIGDTISRMSEIASAIASAVEEQGAATQ